MKYSYNWLKELSGTKKTVKEAAGLFLTHSFEVENIEDLAKGLDGVVVGTVLEVEKHPDADRLNVAQVQVKSQKSKVKSEDVLQIVCGAPNLKVGQKVPVALVGAKLPTGSPHAPKGEDFFEIKKSKIRGVESNGMICAEDELGLGEDHKGIMVLADAGQSQTDAELTLTNAEGGSEPVVGQSLAEYLHLNDKILDIDILPNRGHDCLSYSGVALELNALEGNEFKTKNLNFKMKDLMEESKNNTDLKVQIDTSNCTRYAGIKIKNIQIKPSPQWMQARLKATGIKPINNIVDITNYVMLETNQPMHAFSAKNIKSIGVRQATAGEKIKLLDEQELELTSEDIVITDSQKPIALAGLMGGLDSRIQDNTTEIILEGANFMSTPIRFTARKYNLLTDAAYRFERDIDPNFVETAMSRAVELIKELAEGEIEAVTDIYPEPVKPWQINLSLEHVGKLLGVKIQDEEIKNILERLGIVIEIAKGWLDCTIPTRRRDLRTEEDLIEEIGRIYGYDKIKPEAIQAPVQIPQRNEQRFFERQLKNIATANGFSEIRGYSFHNEKDAEVLGLKKLKHIELLNPASPEQAMLRNTLAINILKAGRKSLSYFKEVRIFEIGKVYRDIDDTLPQEILSLAGGVFSKEKDGTQFYEIKGLLDVILEGFGISDYYYDDNIVDDEKPKGMPDLHPSRQALLKTNSGKILGWLGEVDKKTTKHFGLKNVRGAVLGIEIDKLRKEVEETIAFKPLSKFPFVERDLSIVVGEKLRVGEVENILYKSGGELLRDVDLFDLYQNKETGERSMAFHLIFGDEKKTLQSKEIDDKITEIIKTVETELNVEVKK